MPNDLNEQAIEDLLVALCPRDGSAKLPAMQQFEHVSCYFCGTCGNIVYLKDCPLPPRQIGRRQ